MEKGRKGSCWNWLQTTFLFPGIFYYKLLPFRSLTFRRKECIIKQIFTSTFSAFVPQLKSSRVSLYEFQSKTMQKVKFQLKTWNHDSFKDILSFSWNLKNISIIFCKMPIKSVLTRISIKNILRGKSWKWQLKIRIKYLPLTCRTCLERKNVIFTVRCLNIMLEQMEH